MDKILIFDCGGQYTHLIARRIRELGVFSKVVSPEISIDAIAEEKDVKGGVISGGASSVYDKDAPPFNPGILSQPIPILGICYGHQLIAHLTGGQVALADVGEYGKTALGLKKESQLLRGLKDGQTVWMNHRDIVQSLPKGFEGLASTNNSLIAAFENRTQHRYGVQFHPEVTHTENGLKVFDNFVRGICKAQGSWDSSSIADLIITECRRELKDQKAIMALSGGVDSSTAALLARQAIGKNLTAVYVDTGLMRAGETDLISKTFSKHSLDVRVVDGKERFFAVLHGVLDPEKKRKIIGKAFIDIFDEVAQEVGATTLIQGTIYSDRIESGMTRHSSTIKSHHNVGGLPKDMKLRVYEPLRELYKDEVRRLARTMGLQDGLISRHVFPGPGLAIRIIGEVTPERAEVCRQANHIVEDELRKAGLYEKVWMGFAVLLPIKSVGIQGDARTYKNPVAIRIIDSIDAMTANATDIPISLLKQMAGRITSEIPQVNRVVYDLSDKPPATMEWE